jgi:hypothetical protein
VFDKLLDHHRREDRRKPVGKLLATRTSRGRSYRAHFDDRRRESLRAKLEARDVAADVAAEDVSNAPQTAAAPNANVVDLQAKGRRAH